MSVDKNPGCEMEITPEMIEAGERILNDLLDATIDPASESGLMCIPGGWAEAVYRAMHDTKHHPRGP